MYFLLQVVPLDWKFYRDLFGVNWLQFRFSDIFNLAHYAPRFGSNQQSFLDWGIIFTIALAGGLIWSFLEKDKQNEYNQWYYWLRTLVRYRLAIGIIAYGFVKFFPIQAPYPSLSNLNTYYGDFTRWKLFSLSLGIVPGYESFLGAVEIIAGLLLLYRRTASIGAFIIIIFTGNVFVSNLAYEGGEQVYSLYLVVLALFVLFYDLERLFRLLILQKPASPSLFKPVYAGNRQRYGRILIKAVLVLFFVVGYGISMGVAYYHGISRFPAEKGLDAMAGIYNVRSFRVNNDTLSYSPSNPNRWQDVVFEKWNTISVRSLRPVKVDSNNIERFDRSGQSKAYELEGSAGRHYYSYTADTVQRLLFLRNKNKHSENELLVLHYQRAGDSSLLLSGINEHKDSIFIVLDKIRKSYLLEEVARRGRQKPIKL